MQQSVARIVTLRAVSVSRRASAAVGWVGRGRRAAPASLYRAVSTATAISHWNVDAYQDTLDYCARLVSLLILRCYKYLQIHLYFFKLKS